MADFTITVSNQLYPLGPDAGTPSLWNVFQWGDLWQFTPTGLVTETEKVLANSISQSDEYFFDAEKVVSNDVTPSDEYSKHVERSIENTLAPSFETSDETLTNGSWNYVFRRPSTNAEDRNLATFSTQSNAQTTWTSATITSSTWS